MKIGQLASIVGCTVEAVRFYEKQGLIEPAKRTSGNFRVYTEEHLKQLSFICYCRSLDISLKEIKMLLNPQCATQEQEREINDLLDRHIREVSKRIHELAHLRIRLIQLKGKCSQFEQNNDLMNTLLQHSGINFVPLK